MGQLTGNTEVHPTANKYWSLVNIFYLDIHSAKRCAMLYELQVHAAIPNKQVPQQSKVCAVPTGHAGEAGLHWVVRRLGW